MDGFEKELDDLLSLSETNSSSSSNPEIFKINQPFVLELHDIVKDDPKTETVAPAGKIKKKKKKKNQQDTESRNDSSSSSILSDSIARFSDTVERDKFYDADESYHEAADGKSTDGTNVLTLADVKSKQSDDETVFTEQTQSRRTSATRLNSLSTITKPSVSP